MRSTDWSTIREELQDCHRNGVRDSSSWPHLGKGGKVRGQKFRGTAGVLDLGDDGFAAAAIAAMDQDPPAVFAQRFCTPRPTPSVEPVISAVFPLGFAMAAAP